MQSVCTMLNTARRSLHSLTAPATGRRRDAWEAAYLHATGVQLDVGAPDGIGASLLVTPGRFLRLPGRAEQWVGAGVRLGATLVGFPSSAFRPILGIDGGYVFGGAAAWLPQLIGDEAIRGMVSGATVAFANAQIGFEVGSKYFAFTLRGGLSYVDVGLANQSMSTGAVVPTAGGASGGSPSSISGNGLSVYGFIPARLGFLICFG